MDAIKKEEAVFNSFKELKTFGDNVAALMDLTTGRLWKPWWSMKSWAATTWPRSPRLYAVLDENFGTEEYGVGLRKDDAELLAKLERSHQTA